MLNIIIPHYNNYEGLKDLLKSLSLLDKIRRKKTVLIICPLLKMHYQKYLYYHLLHLD